ncbi:MAG: hypothetical protein M3Q69_03585 [Acidobacteriota bacterium]|nr:hypothetical protein [Acidobacteriota bacterium]
MKRLVLFALLLLVSLSLFAADIPKTPAGNALTAWLESFNTHDVATRRQWLTEHTSLPKEKIERFASIDVEMREENGTLEVTSVTATGDNAVTASLETKSGVELSIEITVDAAEPHRITNTTLRRRG